MTPKAKQVWTDQAETGEEGYLLLGLVVVCFLLLLTLAIAAPRVAKQLERDREVESEHRAQEYVRAIQLFYRRTKRFPTSVEELLGTGTTGGMSSALQVKYLRQQYKDPLTGGDYRLILVGKAKTEVKGFFGEPLEGAPIGSLGSVAGMQSSSGFSNPATTSGSTSGAGSNGSGLSFGSGMSFGGTQSGSATGSASGSSIAAAMSGSEISSSSSSGTDATSFQGSKGAFLGVGSNAKGHGQVEWNGSENIEDWEFLYDPRVEVLKAKVSIFGGSPAASGSGSLGTPQGSSGLGFGNGSGIGGGTTANSAGSSATQSGFGSTSTQTPSSTTTGSTTDLNSAMSPH